MVAAVDVGPLVFDDGAEFVVREGVDRAAADDDPRAAARQAVRGGLGMLHHRGPQPRRGAPHLVQHVTVAGARGPGPYGVEGEAGQMGGEQHDERHQTPGDAPASVGLAAAEPQGRPAGVEDAVQMRPRGGQVRGGQLHAERERRRQREPYGDRQQWCAPRPGAAEQHARGQYADGGGVAEEGGGGVHSSPPRPVARSASRNAATSSSVIRSTKWTRAAERSRLAPRASSMRAAAYASRLRTGV